LNGEYKTFPKRKRIPKGASPKLERVVPLREASGKVVFREGCTEVNQTALLVPKYMNWIGGCETG